VPKLKNRGCAKRNLLNLKKIFFQTAKREKTLNRIRQTLKGNFADKKKQVGRIAEQRGKIIRRFVL